MCRFFLAKTESHLPYEKSRRWRKEAMQNLKEEQIHIAGENVLIVSWCDSKQHLWHAFAPQDLTEWCGTKKSSRSEVIENLASFLTEYIELGELGDRS